MSIWVSVGAIAISGAVAVGVSAVGDTAVTASQAQSGADAAALAGAGAGVGAAERAALANGVTLRAIVIRDDTVEVEVRLGHVSASATAQRVLIAVQPQGLETSR